MVERGVQGWGRQGEGVVTYAAVLLRLRLILPEELPLCSLHYSLLLLPYLFLSSHSLTWSMPFCFSICCVCCSAVQLCFNLNCCSFCAVCRLPHLPVATWVTKLMKTNRATNKSTVRAKGKGRGTKTVRQPKRKCNQSKLKSTWNFCLIDQLACDFLLF